MASNNLFMECFDKTEHFSKHWKELGARLRLEMHCLDEIESNHPRDVGRCRMEMLATWLRSSPADPAAELDTALDKLKHTVHGEKIYSAFIVSKMEFKKQLNLCMFSYRSS